MWDEIEKILKEDSLLNHPFYQAWQKGILTRDDLKVYAQEYYHLEAAFPRFISRIHSSTENPEVRKALAENLKSEELDGRSHRELWLDFAAGLGLSPERVAKSEPTASTGEAINEFWALCASEDWREGAAALHAYEAQQPQIAKTKKEGLSRHYGFSAASPALEFFRAHEELDPWHSGVERRCIEDHGGVTPGVIESARRAAKALWGFLDGVAEQISLESRVSCSLN